MLRKGEQYTAPITGYTSEGQGVARIDGQAVFVAGAIAGEVAELEIQHVGNRGAFAEIKRLETVSPHRRDRACPLGKRCGGCDFWHMDYAEELRLKSQRVRDALTRIGGTDPGEIPICGADSITAYRNKAVFPVAKGKHGPVAGFFQARTHQIIPVDRCLIQPEAADLAKDIVLKWMKTHGVSAYDEQKHTGCVRNVYTRTTSLGQILVCITANAQQLPAENVLVAALQADIPGLRTVVHGIHTQRSNAVLGGTLRNLYGDGMVEETLCGLNFQLSARSFFQVNRDQAQRLYEKAIALAGLTGSETALDLYCGTGTIGLILSRHAKQVIGVEVVEAAIADAKENAARNGVTNAEFLCADAGQAAEALASRGERPDVVVVDPPRKGLAPEVVDAVCRMAPQRVVYVSCDPATLARDVARFAEQGYRLQAAEAVDMFPRCAHVETVVLLQRENA